MTLPFADRLFALFFCSLSVFPFALSLFFSFFIIFSSLAFLSPLSLSFSHFLFFFFTLCFSVFLCLSAFTPTPTGYMSHDLCSKISWLEGGADERRRRDLPLAARPVERGGVTNSSCLQISAFAFVCQNFEGQKENEKRRVLFF